ncbi:MAG: YfiR family protein [Thiobacillus sp.]|nr:YfiR family protein [Thiobacillus sp.]
MVAFLSAFLTCTVWAEADRANVDTVKAGFVYNFMKFTTWPASSTGSHLRVCVLGEGRLIEQFQRLEGRSVGDRTLDVLTLPIPEGLETCQVIFLTARHAYNAETILGQLDGHPVLTISDRPGFIQMGGMIELVETNGRMRFEVNLATSQQAGLKLSSQMLKLAGRVLK